MSEPAELLLIKDQYELAFHCLSRGLSLEEGGDQAKAEEYYRKGQQHLIQGLGIPTGGPRQKGPVWDRARELQQRMKGTLETVGKHISDLDASLTPPPGQRQRLLMELTPSLYPLLPAHSPLQHLYPSIPPASQGPAAAAPAAVADPNTLPPLPARRTQPTMSDPQAQPPAYTPQPADGHHSLAHTPAPGEWSGTELEKRNELLLIPAGVQMFFVAPSGQVSALSHPGYLRIVTFEPQHQDPPDGRGPFFLDVCGWLYSLSPHMPVLLATSEIFMFPDTLAPVPGAFVGIVLSSQLPAADREVFEDLMKQLTDFRVQSPDGVGSGVISLSETIPLGPQVVLPGKDKAPLPTWSEKMGEGILSGASRLGHGLVRGAEATTRAINKGALKIRDRLTPEDTPSEVSPHVSRSLQVAKQATDGAVRVSNFLVNGVSTVAEHIAEKMAPHMKKHSAKLIPESMKGKEGEPSNLEGAKFVALSSLQGFSAVWTSLETGAKLIGKSVTSETVQTVTYKFRGLERLLHKPTNKANT
uniref:spartin a isoform X2 n=1 Tax=Doryrhamphus excisus TaxID=161450 RepID=UPI0025ADB290|nr:spartin a isoform X2 [Doryrhamphus excisus]